jgi:hypothetical protein
MMPCGSFNSRRFRHGQGQQRQEERNQEAEEGQGSGGEEEVIEDTALAAPSLVPRVLCLSRGKQMSTQQGRAAIKAASVDTTTPRRAWIDSITQESESQHVIDKECPRITYLLLASMGKLHGIPEGSYLEADANNPKSVEISNIINKSLKILISDPTTARNKVQLWRNIGSHWQSQESTLDVIIALFEANLLILNS